MFNYVIRNFKPFSIAVLPLFLFLVHNVKQSCAAVYLDGSATGCINGSTTYNPATRSCGSGNNTVSLTLADFNSRIVIGATNYLRAGNYYRTSGNEQGALHIARSKQGTSTAPTIIKAYTGEERQVVIATAADKFRYNPNPGATDTTGTQFYPNAAVTVMGNYIIVDGIKTYGQVVFWDWTGGDAILHDSTVQNSDLGGGGPDISINQGQVILIHDAYNITVQNNKIHNSVRGDASWNGAAIMGYNFHATITKNDFYDNYEVDVMIKDTGGQSGRTIEVSNNFFRPSTIFAGGGTGLRSHNQDATVSNLYIHHNIFLNKESGLNWAFSAASQNNIYNNTFINCATDIVNEMNQSPSALSYFNNIFYHSTGIPFIDFYLRTNLANANWNLYYTASGSPSWRIRYTPVATAISGWKTYSGIDSDSVWANPNFINASGSTATDFKRSSYSENFTTSTYATKAGAYATGSEIIGATFSASTVMQSPSIMNFQYTNP